VKDTEEACQWATGEGVKGEGQPQAQLVQRALSSIEPDSRHTMPNLPHHRPNSRNSRGGRSALKPLNNRPGVTPPSMQTTGVNAG